MNKDTEYRGAIITTPPNDDGAWRWAAFYKKGTRTLDISGNAPRPAFETRNAAIVAAKYAIDEFYFGQRPSQEVRKNDDTLDRETDRNSKPQNPNLTRRNEQN